MTEKRAVLVVRAGGHDCGLPVEHVVETFRPLPVDPLGEAPFFVLGLARVRGEATPVLDLARLLNANAEAPFLRYVSLRVEGRRVALAVESVGGLRELDPEQLGSLPPLLSQAAPAVEALGVLDQGLLLVLRAAKLLPPEDLGQGAAA